MIDTVGLALAVWVLVAPGDNYSWVIVDGPWPSSVACEEVREQRLDAERVLCTRLGK